MPLAIVASRMPEELMESELRRPREVPDVEMQGGSDTEGARGKVSKLQRGSARHAQLHGPLPLSSVML